jgi:hypothetical protein
MNVKPIDNLLKSHFHKLFKAANDKAIKDYDENINKNTSSLNSFDTYITLIKEGERIDKIIENHQYPFYVENFSSEDWLLSQFASRTFLLNKDESDALIDSIYIGKYGLIDKNGCKNRCNHYCY